MSAPKKWSAQPGLFDYAKSHWNDPETSRQAAESISPEALSLMQERIITCFKFHGPEMSDEQLVDFYHGYWGEGTDQGIRTRRGELVRKARSTTPASEAKPTSGGRAWSGGWRRDCYV